MQKIFPVLAFFLAGAEAFAGGTATAVTNNLASLGFGNSLPADSARVGTFTESLAVPEPAACALIGLALFGAISFMRKR